jgi:hypothetical protein
MKISKLKTLLVSLATAASIPSAMADPGNNPPAGQNPIGLPHGPGTNFVPVLYPFVCNVFDPTPVTAFSGYINITGIRGLVMDLQTAEMPFGEPSPFSTAGSFTLPNVKKTSVNAHNRFTGLHFGLQGYCNDDGCSGPWVFVQAYDVHGNQLLGANVVCANNFPGYNGNCTDFGSDTSTFVTQTFNNASFNFPSTGVSLAGVIIQLFPGCDGSHDTRIVDLDINGSKATFNQPRSVYNYCPLGFTDPRPAPCNILTGSGSGG